MGGIFLPSSSCMSTNLTVVISHLLKCSSYRTLTAGSLNFCENEKSSSQVKLQIKRYKHLHVGRTCTFPSRQSKTSSGNNMSYIKSCYGTTRLLSCCNYGQASRISGTTGTPFRFHVGNMYSWKISPSRKFTISMCCQNDNKDDDILKDDLYLKELMKDIREDFKKETKKPNEDENEMEKIVPLPERDDQKVSFDESSSEFLGVSSSDSDSSTDEDWIYDGKIDIESDENEDRNTDSDIDSFDDTEEIELVFSDEDENIDSFGEVSPSDSDSLADEDLVNDGKYIESDENEEANVDSDIDSFDDKEEIELVFSDEDEIIDSFGEVSPSDSDSAADEDWINDGKYTESDENEEANIDSDIDSFDDTEEIELIFSDEDENIDSFGEICPTDSDSSADKDWINDGKYTESDENEEGNSDFDIDSFDDKGELELVFSDEDENIDSFGEVYPSDSDSSADEDWINDGKIPDESEEENIDSDIDSFTDENEEEMSVSDPTVEIWSSEDLYSEEKTSGSESLNTLSQPSADIDFRDAGFVSLDDNEEFEAEEIEEFPDTFDPEQNVVIWKSPVELKRGIHGVYDVEELVTVLQADKALDICVIRLPKHLNFGEYLVVASSRSYRQMKAMTKNIKRIYKLKKSPSDRYCTSTGEDKGEWVAFDLGNLILHIFKPDVREKYDLETLWTVGREFDDKTFEMEYDVHTLELTDMEWVEAISKGKF